MVALLHVVAYHSPTQLELLQRALFSIGSGLGQHRQYGGGLGGENEPRDNQQYPPLEVPMFTLSRRSEPC